MAVAVAAVPVNVGSFLRCCLAVLVAGVGTAAAAVVAVAVTVAVAVAIAVAVLMAMTVTMTGLVPAAVPVIVGVVVTEVGVQHEQVEQVDGDARQSQEEHHCGQHPDIAP